MCALGADREASRVVTYLMCGGGRGRRKAKKRASFFFNIYIIACADGFAHSGGMTRVRRVLRSRGVY